MTTAGDQQSGGRRINCPPLVAAIALPGEVNVIFRGLFLFVRRPKSIDVYVPNMEGEHVYRAGQWLGETSLAGQPPTQPYLLVGVTPGEGCFPPGGLIFDGYDADTSSASSIFARIVLPRPKEVISLRPTIDPLVTSQDPLNLVTGRRPTCIHILRYDSPELRSVCLLNHNCPNDLPPHDMGNVFDSDTGQLKQFVNLHIVAEEDREVMEDHVVNGFNRLIALVNGVSGAVQLSSDKATGLKIPPDDYRVKGFHPYETFNLVETATLLTQAARSWRQGMPVFPRPDQFTTKPPFSCLPGIAG